MATNKQKEKKSEPIVISEEELREHNRPTGKPVARRKGILESYENNSMVFLPAAIGGGRKPTVMSKGRNWSLLKHEGEKNSSITYNINIPADEQDPAGKILEETAKNLKDKLNKEPQLPNNAIYIKNEEGLKIWKSQKRGRLCMLIELDLNTPRAKKMMDFWTIAKEINKQIENNSDI